MNTQRQIPCPVGFPCRVAMVESAEGPVMGAVLWAKHESLGKMFLSAPDDSGMVGREGMDCTRH